MKEIIRRNNRKIEVLTLEENIPILEYLKMESPHFILRTLSERNFEELKEQEFSSDFLDYFTWNFIADYGQVENNKDLLRIGQENIMGYFTVDSKSIIYHPKESKEYSYIDSGIEYFTPLDMYQLLFEILKENKSRNLLLDLGNRIEKNKIYEPIKESQMMEYALNPEKGKQLVRK